MARVCAEVPEVGGPAVWRYVWSAVVMIRGHVTGEDSRDCWEAAVRLPGGQRSGLDYLHHLGWRLWSFARQQLSLRVDNDVTAKRFGDGSRLGQESPGCVCSP